MMIKKSSLGKGLGALLPEKGADLGAEETFFLCAIDDISTNPYQPRRDFDNKKLKEMAASIAEKGLIQPLIVRRAEGEGSEYQLIAGERRWRAARLAGLKEVPVAVKDVSGVDLLELALIENIQRQDLNPLEESAAYDKLMVEFGMSQKEVALKVGKDRSTVANAVRLLQLPGFVRKEIATGKISAGHARALLKLGDDLSAMEKLHNEILRHNLSVRQTEDLAKKIKEGGETREERRGKRKGGTMPRPYCRTLINALESYLNGPVKIVQSGSQGKLEIVYESAEDLERILSLIIKRADTD